MSNFEQLFMKAKKELMETKEEFDEFKGDKYFDFFSSILLLSYLI